MQIAASILTEAALSFLGIGDRNTVSWGKMIFEGGLVGDVLPGACHRAHGDGLLLDRRWAERIAQPEAPGKGAKMAEPMPPAPRPCISLPIALRAMLLEPDFVVADEPVSMLDVSVRAEILNFLLDLRADRGTAFLFITHDIGVARYVSDRIAVMYLGRVIEEGPAEEVIRDPLPPYTVARVAGSPDPEIAGGARPRSRGRLCPRWTYPEAADLRVAAARCCSAARIRTNPSAQ